MNLIMDVGDWADGALCAQTGIDDETWFPSKGQSPRVAKAVCVKCPAIAECLAWALENNEDGVWGATTAEERKLIRAGKNVPRPHLCAECGRTYSTKSALHLHARGHEKRCRNGHDLTLPNAMYERRNSGRRECHICKKDRDRKKAA